MSPQQPVSKSNPGKPSREELLHTPVEQIDFEKVKSVGDLVEAFKNSSIQSRNIGQCAQVYENMLSDPDRPTIILGLSGPLIAAGMRKILRDLVVNGLVDVIVSTGAVLYQDYYQARGYQHYLGSPDYDDVMLRDHMIDRIYDTLVDEEKFGETDSLIGDLACELTPGSWSSREFLDYLGSTVSDPNSIMYNCHKLGVPMFAPALNDSSIGIGLTNMHVKMHDQPHMFIDSIRDNFELTQILVASKKTGAIYIGGGTPKNYINDAVVMANYSMNREVEGHEYALQITSANPMDGGLSGSTLEEAQSWGKIYANAKKATAYVEASIGLPLVAGSILQNPELWQERNRLEFKWDGDMLQPFQ